MPALKRLIGFLSSESGGVLGETTKYAHNHELRRILTALNSNGNNSSRGVRYLMSELEMQFRKVLFDGEAFGDDLLTAIRAADAMSDS